MPAVGVLGAGAWGTALACVAARAGHEVVLCARDPALAERLRTTRENAARLPGVLLEPAVRPTADERELASTEPVLLAVPAQSLRAAALRLPNVAQTLVICAKGLEQATGKRLSEVLRESGRGTSVAVLSGPSFAAEVAAGLPTAVTIAASEVEAARRLCGLIATASFRPYPSDDVAGVELGGALKNVIAIAAGVTMGRGLGENARAALITRGLAEMARLGERLGGRRETLMGLSGLGDLLLTATSLTSRNTRFGYELGQGRPLAELTKADAALAEGVWTAAAALRLGTAVGIELPITAAVARVVAGAVSIDAALDELLSRPLPARE